MFQGLPGRQMLVLTLLLALYPAAALPLNFTSRQEALAHCNQYEDLYEAIHEDLSPWRQAAGIDKDLMHRAVMQFTVLGRSQRGVQLGFSGGKAYVIVGNLTNTPVGWIGHHAHIFFTYMQVMLELEELFGDAIPDVEFVIASGDKPMVLKQERALSLYRDKGPGIITQTSETVTTHAVTSSTVTTVSTKVTNIVTRLLRSIGSRRRMLSSLFRDQDAEQQQQQTDSQDPRQPDAGKDTQRAIQQVLQQQAIQQVLQQKEEQTLALVSQQDQQDAVRLVSQQDGQMDAVRQTEMVVPRQTAELGQQARNERMTGAGQAAGRARKDSGKRQRALAAQKKSGDMLTGQRLMRKKVNMDLPLPSLGVPVPVFRFCSSPGHADIRQPNFHFYTKKYNQRFLARIPNITATFPWEGRKEVLFGRFSRYFRLIHPNVSETYRWGANGSEICIQETRDSSSCRVRQHFFDLSAQSGGLMDVHSKPKIPMSAHPQYKYLVHLDGQGLSSRLDQLLPLGSLVFKEESGYTTYYHHLLKPYVHYVPFWEKDPLEAIDRMTWAKANDEEARGIAEAGQQFAIRYLSKRARTCYWFKLISEFSKLLTYKPASGAGAMNETWVPIEEYFRTVAMTYEGGARFTPGIEQ